MVIEIFNFLHYLIVMAFSIQKTPGAFCFRGDYDWNFAYKKCLDR